MNFNFLSLLKKIVKFEFSPPTPKKILIYDVSHYSLLKKFFKNENQIGILHTRLEVINLFILLKCIFKMNFKLKAKSYFQEYVNYVRPKILITMVDNDINFYQIKCPNGKKIFIQNGKRTLFDIFYFLKKDFNQKYHVDKMFVHNYLIGDLYQKYIKGKYSAIGSVNSNFYKINNYAQNQKDKYLTYISSFRKGYLSKDEFVFKNIKYRDYIKFEEKLLGLLNIYLKKKNLKLNILAKFDYQDFEIEKNYYLNYFDKRVVNIIKNHKKRNTFMYLDKSELNIGCESTLLYEAFGRGKKTYFFGIRGKNKLSKSRNFAWPLVAKKKGLFWNNSMNFDTLEKDLDSMIKISKKNWRKYFIKYRDKVMKFDSGNKEIKKYLNKTIFFTNG